MFKKVLLLWLVVCALTGSLPAAHASQAETMPTPLYVGVADSNLYIRKEPSTDAESVGLLENGEKAYIVSYDPGWLKVVKGTEDSWVTGYVLRHRVIKITPLEGAVFPYGTTPATYTAVLSKDTMLYPAPKAEGDALFLLTEGTKIAILNIEDGWAQVVYWRQYGYFYLDAIEDLTPVFGEELAEPGDTISAFVSFYRVDSDGSNPNRMHNIALACDYICTLVGAGEQFSFDSVAGPYQGVRGYLEANSFFEGAVVPSTGGGSCQVSSTMYNVLLAMPGGIEVVNRRAHGPSGVTYLPHGVDAAVGRAVDGINLVFKNINSFPIEIEAKAHDGVLFIAIIKAE